MPLELVFCKYPSAYVALAKSPLLGVQVLKPKSFLWEGLCYSFVGEADEPMCQCGCNPLVDGSQSLVL